MPRILVLILGWIYLIIYCSAFIIFTVLTFGLLTPFILPPACHGWGRGLLKLSGIKLEVVNPEFLAHEGPRLIIFNHQSQLDIFWLSRTFVKKGIAVVKKEFMYIPFLNLSFWLAGFIFLDRSNKDKAILALNSSLEKIRRKKLSLYMAPEGTRSKTGELLPFKKGPFHMAIEGKLPIYPLVVIGAHELMPKGAIFPNPGKIILKCLPPISTEDWKLEDIDRHIEFVRTEMQRVLLER